MRDRRGFTLVELLIVVTILGILAAVAIPNLKEARIKADAAAILGDFNTIRHAAFDQAAETGTFPRNGGWGRVPPPLVPSLPDGFEFTYKDATYRWRRWSLQNGLPRRRNSRALIGLQVRSRDQALIAAIVSLYGGRSFGNSGSVVLVIE